MSKNKQMWTTRYFECRDGPYLINVTPAFVNCNTTFINLDSTCQSGGDEYINNKELFETEREAIFDCIKTVDLHKQELIKAQQELDNLKFKLQDKLNNIKNEKLN